MTNYILLILVNILTYLSICTYEFYPVGSYDESLNPYRLFTPGLLFSLYIVFVQRKERSFLKLALFVILLFVLYCASVAAGLSSFGFAVPFAGGIGALLLKQLFYNKTQLLDTMGKSYLSIGLIAGGIGYGLFYLTINAWAAGVGFALILILWQIAIGILWIKTNSDPPVNS